MQDLMIPPRGTSGSSNISEHLRAHVPDITPNYNTMNIYFDTVNIYFDTVNIYFDTVNIYFDTVNIYFDGHSVQYKFCYRFSLNHMRGEDRIHRALKYKRNTAYDRFL